MIKRLTVLSILFYTYGVAFGGSPLKELEKLYQKHEYEELLQMAKIMEQEGYYRYGRYILKYGNNDSFYALKFKATFNLLLAAKNPKKHQMLIKLAMKDYQHLTNIDKDKKFNATESETIYAFKQHLKKQAEIVYQNNSISAAEQYVKYIAVTWQDTIPLYSALYFPKPSAIKLKHERDYAAVDSFASASLKFNIQSTKQLAKYLTDSLPNDCLKVRAIYTYLVTHIAYDYESLYSGRFINIANDSKNRRGENTFVHSILLRKKGVCSDFAWAFKNMNFYAGIEAGVIQGWAKGSGWKNTDINLPVNHAWNYVVIKGDTLLVEVTWASCIGNKDFYFLADPSKLIYTHLPEVISLQLLKRPINRQQFVLLPDVYPTYFQNKENPNNGYLNELTGKSKESKSAMLRGTTKKQ